MAVKYEVPPPKPDPKIRFTAVTDADTISAIQRAELKDPIGGDQWKGKGPRGQWRADAHSLAQARRIKVEFDV